MDRAARTHSLSNLLPHHLAVALQSHAEVEALCSHGVIPWSLWLVEIIHKTLVWSVAQIFPALFTVLGAHSAQGTTKHVKFDRLDFEACLSPE